MQKKNEIYEEKKKLIIKNMNPDRTDKNKFVKPESRQTVTTDGNYDPDYNRNLNRPLPQPMMPQNIPQPMFQQQPIMQNPMMVQQNMAYGNNFGGFQQNPTPIMKFTPPVYQNFPQNNLLNDLNFPNNTTIPPQNTLFNQLGYNNYGIYPQNTSPPMNLGMFPQQQGMQQPNFNQNVPTNFQGNPYGEIRKNQMPPIGPNILGGKKPLVVKENKMNLEKILNEENFPTLEQAVQKH